MPGFVVDCNQCGNNTKSIRVGNVSLCPDCGYPMQVTEALFNYGDFEMIERAQRRIWANPMNQERVKRLGFDEKSLGVMTKEERDRATGHDWIRRVAGKASRDEKWWFDLTCTPPPNVFERICPI